MTTPLYPTFQKRIEDAVAEVIERQVTPWSFLSSGKPFQVKKFNGKHISYEGGGFEGSPSDVFWGRYIESFLENLCLQEIDAAIDLAKEKSVDATLLLPEVQGLLSGGIRRVFNRMSDVDRRLRGAGYPDRVQPRPVEREVAAMNEFVETHIQAALAMWKPKSFLRVWHENNPF